jgi:hypothetical protein
MIENVATTLRFFAVLSIALLFGAVEPASACMVITTDNSASARRKDARTAVEGPTAIIDGEVIRPYVPDVQNALVRAHRVIRGPAVELFEVGEQTSCDIVLMDVGQRSRMLLVGGPDVYFLPWDQSNARYEDRLLGSDRRIDWPYHEGVYVPND